MSDLATPPLPVAPAGSTALERLRHQRARLQWILDERNGHPTIPRLRVWLRVMGLEITSIVRAMEEPAPVRTWRIRRGVLWRLRRLLRRAA